MAQISEDKLFRAISEDDVDAFNHTVESVPCGQIRMGRFPVLSLLYLYNSRKILALYEQEFIKITKWDTLLPEPTDAVKRFSDKAGKCLRLYFDAVVSPLEMLLILDDTKRLKKIYPLCKPSDAVKTRLKSVYFVRYSLGIEFNGDEIIIERRPLKRKEKRKIIIAACVGALGAAAVIATPIAVVSYVLAHEGDVTQLSQIRFSSSKTYTLKSDITVPANYSVGAVNCTIIGDGHKIVFGANASLGEFNGRLSDVVIETSGDPIFTLCTENAVISNATVNVDTDIQMSEDWAFVAVTNYGNIDGVTVNVSGEAAVSSEFDGSATDLYLGGIVSLNAYYFDLSMTQPIYGKITNCTVNYTNFNLKGLPTVNGALGGVAGINNGLMSGCKTTGDIVADTFDLAGICVDNNSSLTDSVNEANLKQTSSEGEWYPTVGGIVMNNTSSVQRCKNVGDITVVGQDLIVCGGISAYTVGGNDYCLSSGNINITAKSAYAGGIYAVSQYTIYGNTIYFGYADHCISQADINLSLDEESCVGGVGGLVWEGDIYGDYFGGGVVDCIFMGEVTGATDYFGNIVGVCGKHIYEENSYTSGNTEYPNFDANYYIENSYGAFGATATMYVDTENILQIASYTKMDGQGKGATQLTENEIKGSSLYSEIKEVLGL